MEHDHITPAEKALLFALEEDLKGLNGLKVLVAGNRSGHLPCALAQAGANVTAHLFDCFHVQAMRTRLHEAGFDADAIIRCTAQIPEGPYDRAYFMTTPLSMTGELVLDQLEDITVKVRTEALEELTGILEECRDETNKACYLGHKGEKGNVK